MSRLTGLDGLRGAAALVVVVYHCTKIAGPELSGGSAAVLRALADSPAKVAFAGTEAVLVFFALSGLVVALPALRDDFGWRGYYGARLIRLYIPVWAALAFAAALILLIPRDPSGYAAGEWLRASNSTELSWPRLLAEASLWPASYDIDNVLWSLRWEVIFSLALPAFVAVALALRRAVLASVIAAIALSMTGRLLDIDALVYLPVFLAGTLLATRIEELREWGARRGRAFWAGATALSLVLLISGWLARPLVPAGTPGGRLLWGAAAAGAVGLVAVAIGSRLAERVLSSRIPAWLGRVSFSLYLVHVPILATLAFLWGPRAWPAVIGVGFVVSLVVAEVFRRLVEQPSHRLAQRVRTSFGRAAVRRAAVPAPSAR